MKRIGIAFFSTRRALRGYTVAYFNRGYFFIVRIFHQHSQRSFLRTALVGVITNTALRIHSRSDFYVQPLLVFSPTRLTSMGECNSPLRHCYLSTALVGVFTNKTHINGRMQFAPTALLSGGHKGTPLRQNGRMQFAPTYLSYHPTILSILVQTKEKMMNVPNDEKIAPTEASYRVARRAGRGMNKEIQLRFKKK